MVKDRYKQRRLVRQLQRKVFFNKSLVKKNQKCRCLVVLHLFYENSWIEINEYLRNLAPYSFDLIITTTDGQLSKEMLGRITKEYPGAKIIGVENRGEDILPFLAAIKDVDLSSYDIVFKLHSIGTRRRYHYIYHQFFGGRDWFVTLFEGILSAKNVHKTIDILYNQKEIGLVAAANLIVKDPKHRAILIRKMAEKEGLAFIEDYYFVAGTCFAIKAECLKPILDRHFEKNEFAPRVPARGMSFDAFVERYFGISVLLQGYLMKGNPANTIRRLLLKPMTLLMNRLSSERLFEEDIILDDEWFYWQMDNKVIKYKFDSIRFNEIKCIFEKNVSRMIDGIPYRYIKEGDVAAYERYCKVHRETGLPLMSKERYDRLIESMNQNGYDKRNIIIVNEQNLLKDGQHRACILASKYGEDSYVRVLKIWDLKQLLKKALARINIT